MFDLKGKVAVVTGGNGGIGLGMAQGLAAAGARVVVAGRNQSKSAAAVRQLGGQALAIPVDVADETSVNALIKSTLDQCGRLDILVNNAGTNIRSRRRSCRSPTGIRCSIPTSPRSSSRPARPTRR